METDCYCSSCGKIVEHIMVGYHTTSNESEEEILCDDCYFLKMDEFILEM